MTLSTGENSKPYAGFLVRFGAGIIDLIAVYTLILLINVFLFNGIHPDYVQILWIVNTFLLWLYFTGMESSSFQATLGKKVVGIIVVNEQSETITLGQATIRLIIKIIPLVNILSFIMVALDTEQHQGLHDRFAITYVIKKM